MDLQLQGKVAMITGASKGIGKACAMALAREGASVTIVARGPELLEQAAAEIRAATGAQVLAVPGDLTRQEDADHAVARTVERFGRLDILINNAGSAPGGCILDLEEKHWQQALQLKFMGYVRGSKAALPQMLKQGGGRIVNVIGNDGVKPSYWEVTATAANAADINLTIALADQYGKHNILVNAVNPGPVNTDRWRTLCEAFARDMGTTPEEAHQLAIQSMPLGRIPEPEEIADVVIFLSSPRASFVNGAIINLDGGQRKAIMDDRAAEIRKARER